MNKINKKAFKPIDQKEKDLMESIERDEWQPVKDFDRERKKAIEAAQEMLRSLGSKAHIAGSGQEVKGVDLILRKPVYLF